MREWLIVNSVYFGVLIGFYVMHKRDVKNLYWLRKNNKKVVDGRCVRKELMGFI